MAQRKHDPEKRRERYLKNRDRDKNRALDYYNQNKDVQRDRQREYYLKNRDKIIKKSIENRKRRLDECEIKNS